jgi:hypothetical protein
VPGIVVHGGDDVDGEGAGVQGAVKPRHAQVRHWPRVVSPGEVGAGFGGGGSGGDFHVSSRIVGVGWRGREKRHGLRQNTVTRLEVGMAKLIFDVDHILFALK